MTPLPSAWGAAVLDPDPDQARSWLRRELLKPDYQDRDVVRRLLDRLARLLDDGLAAAAGASWLQTLAAMAVLVLLAAGTAWLLTRARRSGAVRLGAAGVLTAERVSADELRRRAHDAWEAGRWSEAVVEGFRALARRQVEQGRLADDPGATAREVAVAVAAAYPDRAQRVQDSAGVFDGVRYGDRPATADQARAVLTLDDDLAGVR